MGSAQQGVAGRVSGPAFPLHAGDMDWIPAGDGKSFRPLRFEPDGWLELMRLEPGSVVSLHRHTCEVHAFNLSGTRESAGFPCGWRNFLPACLEAAHVQRAVGELTRRDLDAGFYACRTGRLRVTGWRFGGMTRRPARAGPASRRRSAPLPRRLGRLSCISRRRVPGMTPRRETVGP